MLACVSEAGAQSPPPWTTTFNTEVRYFSSHDSLGNRNSQVYTPLAAQATGYLSNDWKASFLVRSGYIWSSQSNAVAGSRVETPTDTNVTPTLTYLGWRGITPYVSVALNLPTANKSSNPFVTQSNGKTDADVVPTPAFGEGLNVGPTVGANVNVNESTVLGLGVGHTWRGEFDQATTVTVSRFDPGDVTTGNVTLGYRGERLSLQGSLSYSVESTTHQGGLPLYQAGDRIIAIAKAGYAWTEMWSSRASVTFSHFEKNNVQPSAGVSPLVAEAFNSNSNVTRVTLDTTYAAADYSIGPTVTYLYRDRNGYDPNTFQFLPAKTSWSAGVGGSYKVIPAFSLNAAVQHIWITEGANPEKLNALNAIIPGSGIPAASSNAWIATLGGSYKF